ncbi:hypothetical protein [Sulfurimonas crateris]|uniref:hypothetical protein n=1 Tax=Sulfurimonas crateris TaxID=2574727 RepID=UPI001476C5A5|nr:hypothetical protein [Sulfurimonas crateris]
MSKIKQEHILNLLITSIAICANEILGVFVQDDWISATAFGALSFAMLIAYFIIGDKK